jgi:hypothetical protein
LSAVPEGSPSKWARPEEIIWAADASCCGTPRACRTTVPGRYNAELTRAVIDPRASKETGEVRSRIVADVTGATLSKAISAQVNVGGSELQTDAAGQYRALGQEFISHQWI